LGVTGCYQSTAPTSLPIFDSSKDPQCPANSTINMESLALQETIPLVGIPFNLNYSSDRLRSTSTFSPQSLGLGGWTPNPVHFYDSKNQIVYYGNGDIRNIQANSISGGGYYATNEGGTEIYYFNASGVHTQTKNALTGVVKYNISYSANGHLAAVTDQFGNATTFQTSGSNVIITSPYGQSSMLTFDGNGFLASVTDPNGDVYGVTNNSVGYMTNFQKPMGQKSTVTYDSNGYVTEDLGAGGDYLSLVRNFNSSTAIQTVNSSTALNRATIFTESGTTTSSSSIIQSPSGASYSAKDVDMGINSSGDSYGDMYQEYQGEDPRFGWLAPIPQTTSYTVPNSSISIATSLNMTAPGASASNPFGFTTLTSQTTLQNDPTRVFTTTFNNTSKVLTSTSPLNRTTTESLNANSQPASLQVGALLPVSLSYDSRGRVTAVKQGTRTNTLAYDQFGNVNSSTDPLGRVTRFQYDKANRVVQETLPDNSVIAMTWNANGDMTSITPPGKTAHSFSYNLFELVSEYLPPSLGAGLSGATLYSYNLDKQLTQVNLPDGAQIGYNYGASTGLLNSINMPTGNFSITYPQSSDLVSSITSPDNVVLSYSYAGNVLTGVTSSGPVSSSLQFSFNSDGTVSAIAVGANSSSMNSVALGYDKDGLLTNAGDEVLTLNNVGSLSVSTLGKISEAVTFDTYGAPLSDIFKSNPTHVIAQSFYTRDALGRIESVSRNTNGQDHSRSYIYDSQARLTTVLQGIFPVRGYQYDQNGNRTAMISFAQQIHAQYDAQDRLINYGNLEFQYNANGDLTEKIEHDFAWDDTFSWLHYFRKENPRITQYSFDVFENLKSVTLPDGRVITYIVDGQNRMVAKLIDGKIRHSYVYQSQTQVAAELDENGVLVKQFIYGSKVNIPDYMIYKGKEYRIISDQVGTPKLVVDSISGKVLEEISMDEFGFDEDVEREHVLPFGFAGGLRDAETHLVRMGARSYDSETGRFISRDPIGFKGGQTNLYGYTFNDPVNYVDPTGKNPAILPAFGIGFVVGFITGYVTQSELNPNSTAGQLLTAGLQTGVFTGAGAALAASGAGLVAAVAGEIAGVGLNVVTGPSSANVNLQDLSNGINAVQQSGKTCPPAGQ